MGYYADILTPLECIPKAVTEWITAEIKPDGLLEEIDKYCQTYRTEGSILNYEIWVHKMDWTIKEDETYALGDSQSTIEYPFTIAIIVDTVGDEERCEQKAIQLQAKTIMSIFKNFDSRIFPNNEGYVQYYTIDEGYNDGSLEAVNQEEDVIIKGFKLTLTVNIDWIECIRKYNNKNGGT